MKLERLNRLMHISKSLAAVCLYLLCATFYPASAFGENFRYGLWVEAEGKNRPFDSAEGFSGFLDFAEKGRFTDLYCQVYRSGKAWFPTMLADDEPYRAAVRAGYDPLRETIDRLHAQGRRVHAWVNVLRINDNTEAPLFKVIGYNAALVDRYGNSLLDYDVQGVPPGRYSDKFKLDTPGFWLDPSSQRVRDYVGKLIEDVVTRYPDLDGIHLDMIRFPFAIASRSPRSGTVDFGYGEEPVQRFWLSRKAPSTQELNQTITPFGTPWDEWRRSQVTLMVFEIKEMLNRLAPHMELSAAVIAWPERAKFYAFQDWKKWLAGGALDYAIPMAYTKDQGTFRSLSRQAKTMSVADERVLMGIGAWMLNDAAAADQAAAALHARHKGVVLFSFSNLYSGPGRALVERVRRSVLAPIKHVDKH